MLTLNEELFEDIDLDEYEGNVEEKLNERYNFDLVDNAINHFFNDLGKEPEVDEVIAYIERTNPEEVPDDFDKYQKWASDISCEISARLSESLKEDFEDADKIFNKYIGRRAIFSIVLFYPEDWGYDPDNNYKDAEEWEKLLKHNNKIAVIESLQMFADETVVGTPDEFTEQYWDIKFNDGYRIDAVCGLNLELLEDVVAKEDEFDSYEGEMEESLEKDFEDDEDIQYQIHRYDLLAPRYDKQSIIDELMSDGYSFKQAEYIASKTKNLDDSLKEDFEDVVEVDVPVVVNQPEELDKNDLLPEGPDTPEDRGLSDLILSLINDENDAIKQYSIAVANLGTHGEFKQVLDDIATEEYNHVGMLQALLQKLSPNSETIKEGEVEAKEILNGDSLDYTVVEDETTDLEDYEDPDFYSLFGV